jgi:hypothetical protein
MTWCEDNGVDYLFGLAQNERLVARIMTELALAATKSLRTGKPQRRFADFMSITRHSLEAAEARHRQGRTHQAGAQSALCGHLAQTRRGQGALILGITGTEPDRFAANSAAFSRPATGARTRRIAPTPCAGAGIGRQPSASASSQIAGANAHLDQTAISHPAAN